MVRSEYSHGGDNGAPSALAADSSGPSPVPLIETDARGAITALVSASERREFSYDAFGRLAELRTYNRSVDPTVEAAGAGPAPPLPPTVDRIVYDAFGRPVLEQSGAQVRASAYRGMLPLVHGSTGLFAGNISGFEVADDNQPGAQSSSAGVPARDPRYNSGQYRGDVYEARQRAASNLIADAGTISLEIRGTDALLGIRSVNGRTPGLVHAITGRNLSILGVFNVQTNQSRMIGFEVYGHPCPQSQTAPPATPFPGAMPPICLNTDSTVSATATTAPTPGAFSAPIP
jgi:YD repeat-containing protein